MAELCTLFRYGQLGLGDEMNRTLPTQVESLADQKIKQISAGGEVALALTEDGKLFSWGRGQYKVRLILSQGKLDVTTEVYWEDF